METRHQDLRFRLLTIELLKLARKKCTYRYLSEQTGLPVTVLSRYVRGHVLPRSYRAKDLWRSLSKLINLQNEIQQKIKFDEHGYFDNSGIIYDISLLQQAAQYALYKFAGRRITAVLTAAVDGVPLATTIANVFGVKLLVAKKEKEVGVREGFLEEVYIPSDSAVVMTLYLPRRLIRRGDSILIVDDIIRSGGTQKVLINLVEKAKAEVAGIFTLVAVGDDWKKMIKIKCPIVVVVKIERQQTQQ